MGTALLSARAITKPPKHYFAGYYTRRPFDPSDRYVLGLACDFAGRMQTPDDVATVGIVDTEADHVWIPLAKTRAWNWQMGCLADWLPIGYRPFPFQAGTEGPASVRSASTLEPLGHTDMHGFNTRRRSANVSG